MSVLLYFDAYVFLTVDNDNAYNKLHFDGRSRLVRCVSY